MCYVQSSEGDKPSFRQRTHEVGNMPVKISSIKAYLYFMETPMITVISG